MSNLMLMWAQRYLDEGYSLIPLKPKSKEPLIPWTEFQTRRASLTEMTEWLKKWPDMNIGVCTGNISSIVVVDLDGMEGASYGKQNAVHSSVVSLTGNGRQVFYKWTEHVVNSVKKLAPGVDIRGDGGYVVVCPSVHPTGRRYRWERFVPNILAPLPVNIILAGAGVTAPIVTKPEGWIAKALEEMKIGNIDDTMVSILGRMRHDGWTDSDALAILTPVVREKGATEGHLEDKIKHIWSRYDANPRVKYIKPAEIFGQPIQSADGQSLVIHSPANDDSFNRFQLSMEPDERVAGLQTGFPTLDRYFEGGLKSERLFTVAARTGTGKTNFAIKVAAHLCQQGKKVLYFSTEFRYEKIWSRYIATLQHDDFRRHAFFVCDSFSPNIEQVEEAIKRIMPDVFIFDHINHIGEDRETLAAFMQGANFLQRKYLAQGIIVAQLSRQADFVENGKRIEPRMSMIKGSGTIEQASSRVLLLSEVRVTPELNEILGVLDKNDTGDKGLISFGLYKNPYVFKELI